MKLATILEKTGWVMIFAAIISLPLFHPNLLADEQCVGCTTKKCTGNTDCDMDNTCLNRGGDAGRCNPPGASQACSTTGENCEGCTGCKRVGTDNPVVCACQK